MTSIRVPLLKLILAGLFGPSIVLGGEANDVKFSEPESTRVGSLNYTARTLMTSSGGLIGVAVKIRNASDTPLKVRRPRGFLPVGIAINDGNGDDVSAKKRVTSPNAAAELASKGKDKQDYVLWQLAPRASERYFVPVRRLFDGGRIPEHKKRCSMYVYIHLVPASTPTMNQHPIPNGLLFRDIVLNQKDMEIDAELTYREALKKQVGGEKGL